MTLSTSIHRISVRIRIGIALLILFAVGSNVHLLYRGLKEGVDFGSSDPISRYERRFEKIKPLLPTHGVVGYIEEKSLENGVSNRAFFLTQYALAPTIVLHTTNADLVVVNLSDDLHSVFPAAMDGWILMQDCFNGVRLYRRQTP